MEELKIFNNTEFGKIRTLEVEGKIYFVGNDIAKALEYARPYEAVSAHCKGAVSYRIPTNGGEQETKIIPEGDIYRLIVKASDQSKSKGIKEKAERFESWVFDEVLPTLRKTGSYEMPKKENKSDRTRIMEMNARSRMAQTYLKLAQVDTLSSTYKTILAAKAAEVLSGEQLLPLPKSERKVYSAGEIGEKFGISANKVGRIANEHNLKTNKYGEYRRSKSEHSAKEVDTWVYFDDIIPELGKILGLVVN